MSVMGTITVVMVVWATATAVLILIMVRDTRQREEAKRRHPSRRGPSGRFDDPLPVREGWCGKCQEQKDDLLIHMRLAHGPRVTAPEDCW